MRTRLFYDQNQRIINSHFQIVSMVKAINNVHHHVSRSTIITVVSLVGYVTHIHWGLLVIIFLFSITILLIISVSAIKDMRSLDFLTPYHRREMYISDLLSNEIP